MLAADNMEEMKIWMNLLSLASIAFGSGVASRTRDNDEHAVPLSDGTAVDLEAMADLSAERAGGVCRIRSCLRIPQIFERDIFLLC